MGLLGLLKQAKVKVLTFGKHPCNELDEQMKIHYLNGLALIANEDSEREKADSYLASITHSFGFSPDMLEVFNDFAQNPQEQAILDMIGAFETKDIKYNFIIDAMMIAGIDENFSDNKKAVIEQYCEMLKVTKKETEDLEYIYEMFCTQNGNALFRYFGKQKKDDIFTIKSENFQYLLDYYKIDMAYELSEYEKQYGWQDLDTNLIWQIEVEDTLYEWKDIQKSADKLNSENYGGSNDWRVPTIDELKTILAEEKEDGFFIKKALRASLDKNSSLDEHIYWSSSTYEDDKDCAWGVSFGDGNVGGGNKDYNSYVRCVRVGQ